MLTVLLDIQQSDGLGEKTIAESDGSALNAAEPLAGGQQGEQSLPHRCQSK